MSVVLLSDWVQGSIYVLDCPGFLGQTLSKSDPLAWLGADLYVLDCQRSVKFQVTFALVKSWLSFDSELGKWSPAGKS